MYCLGGNGPQVKSILTKELGISHLQFEELIMYSLGFIELLCNGKNVAFMYLFITSQIALIAYSVGAVE